MRVYDGDSIATEVGNEVLKKTGITKTEFLNKFIYCFSEYMPKKVNANFISASMMNSDQRDKYEGFQNGEAPCMFVSNKAAYERNYHNVLFMHYKRKHNSKADLFEKEDDLAFNEIVNYLVLSEFASEIVDNCGYNDMRSEIEKMSFEIKRKPSKNMTRYSHAYLDEEIYNALGCDEIIPYLAERVIEVTESVCMMISINLNCSSEERRVTDQS